MQDVLEIMKMMLICGTVLGIGFVILLALPQSKLRDFLLPIFGWCIALFCAFYAISPFDVLPEAFLGPFGYIEDIGAVATGIAAARMAMNPSKN